jgi:hypothetical protein
VERIVKLIYSIQPPHYRLDNYAGFEIYEVVTKATLGRSILLLRRTLGTEFRNATPWGIAGRILEGRSRRGKTSGGGSITMVLLLSSEGVEEGKEDVRGHWGLYTHPPSEH